MAATLRERRGQGTGADGLLGQHSPRYLIRDNDSKYGQAFARVAEASGIAVLRTAYRAPRENAACERFLGSVRRECL